MRVTRENFKCVPNTFRLQGWLFDHSQRLGLLQTSKLLEKATDGNVPHIRRLQRFQFENPCVDDIREHGTQVWSYDRTSMMFDFNINLLSVKN